jgi:hypothetical protein
VDIELMRIAHDPVGQVFDEFIAKFHFLSKEEILATLHDSFDELTHFCFNVNYLHGRVEVSHVANYVYHEVFNVDSAKWVVATLIVRFAFEH